jgi:hypothetical protein
MRALCLRVQARQNTSAPLLVEWQSWARAFVARLHHRESAVRAALSAGSEAALLELDEADAAIHARLLIERSGPTAAAEMTALYPEMSGSGYWRSVSAKIKPGTAR